MRRQLVPAFWMLVLFTVLTGVVYPLVSTGIAQVAFHDAANGSLVSDADGTVVGSRWIGQPFTGAQYFHPRPSAAGDGYDARASSGSNLGPTNEDLLTAVADRVTAYRTENGLDGDARVPVDAVTASASGLDPHISVANARLQAPRVARERGLTLEAVLRLVDDHTDRRGLGFLGEDGVNVLQLNLALDARGR
jgi:K+-transporting ATPase ATPase C chain